VPSGLVEDGTIVAAVIDRITTETSAASPPPRPTNDETGGDQISVPTSDQFRVPLTLAARCGFPDCRGA